MEKLLIQFQFQLRDFSFFKFFSLSIAITDDNSDLLARQSENLKQSRQAKASRLC